MGRLDKAQDRARDLIGEIGDGLRKRVPDKAVQLIESPLKNRFSARWCGLQRS